MDEWIDEKKDEWSSVVDDSQGKKSDENNCLVIIAIVHVRGKQDLKIGYQT